MNRQRILALSLIALALGGCAKSSVVGTWAGRGDAGDAPFSFGSVSFVGDNTFTAEARYSGNVRVQSGTWDTDGSRLSLDAGGTRRNYSFSVTDDTLTVTDPESGNSITLDRVRR